MLDARKPPSPPGDWVHLAFRHPVRSEKPGLYRRDLRAPTFEGHVREIEVRSRRRAEEVTLVVLHEGVLPVDLAVRLVDRELGVALDVRQPEVMYRLLSFGPERAYSLAILAGSERYVAREGERLTQVPTDHVLDQNVPNPFNAATRIRCGLPRPGPARLEIYNVRGERVATLVQSPMPAGYHSLIWNGMDGNGRAAPSGIYWYRLTGSGATLTKRLVLLE